MHEVINPNWFAYLALLAWPVVAVYLYTRLPVSEATIWTVLGAYLLLPVIIEIKIEMVPALDKTTVPNIAALACCVLVAGRMPRFFHGFGLTEVLILVLILSPIVTGLLNTDPIPLQNGLVLPAAGAYDGGSAAISRFLFIIPFFLGRQFLRSPEDNVQVLRALAIAGLAYSLLMLFEVRMSPQLNVWIYGYFPTAFFQQIRDGGFRPVVFLGKGVLVPFFGVTTIIAVAAFWRTRTPLLKSPPEWAVVYLGGVLFLCKTVAMMAYAAVVVPLVRWASPRAQLRVAVALVILACGYPLLRSAGVVPTEAMLSIAANAVNTERAESLGARFKWEGLLLDRALERPWFGWGRYGRNRVFTGYDGRDVSITDGTWIIDIGTLGLVGFLTEFGLLGLAVFRAAAAFKFVQNGREGVYLGALALIIAVNMVDLLPNSSLSPWTWLLAGSLLGRAEALRAAARQRIDLHLAPARSQGGQLRLDNQHRPL